MAEPAKPPFRLSSVKEYQILAEELELAWAHLTDGERAELDAERARRRRDNPLWPWVTSDHVDRLADKLHRNTEAADRLEWAMTDPEWGLVMKTRALASATDSVRDALIDLNATIERLIVALEKATPS